jgi:polar amino acid transport system permease protein
MAVDHERINVDNRSRFEFSNLRDFPWWLVIILSSIAYVVYRVLTDETYRSIFFIIARGLGTTLYVTAVSFIFSIIFGLILGLGRVSKNIVARNLATTYIEFIRGVPVLVLIFTISFAAVPLISNALGFQGNVTTELTRAIIALVIIYSAYIAEVFRAGIESIGRGQMEAARSLGMTHVQAMRYIILPQAIRNVFPALGNDLIALLKDTSLVSVLGIREITQNSRLYASTSFRYEETYFILTLFYLSMTLALSLVLQAIQRRMSRNV